MFSFRLIRVDRFWKPKATKIFQKTGAYRASAGLISVVGPVTRGPVFSPSNPWSLAQMSENTLGSKF